MLLETRKISQTQLCIKHPRCVPTVSSWLANVHLICILLIRTSQEDFKEYGMVGDRSFDCKAQCQIAIITTSLEWSLEK